MEDMSRKGAKEGEEKAPRRNWCWEDHKEKAREGTREQKREKQKPLAPASALTPNTLVPY